MSKLINDLDDVEMWERVEIERSNIRDRRWPERRPLRQVALMMEEAGESLKEAIDLTRDVVATRPGDHENIVLRQESCELRLQSELIQTITTAIKCFHSSRNRLDSLRRELTHIKEDAVGKES